MKPIQRRLKKELSRHNSPMTKSPKAIARTALEVARHGGLSHYSHRFSRHDFTQAQLFAILVLQAFFGIDFRGMVDLLADLPDLRKELGLKKLPHYSTLCVARTRLLKKGLSSGFKELFSALPEDWGSLDEQELLEQEDRLNFLKAS